MDGGTCEGLMIEVDGVRGRLKKEGRKDWEQGGIKYGQSNATPGESVRHVPLR